MTYYKNLSSKARRQEGFSLIELMIGLVLGLFVIGVVVTVFVQSKRNFTQDEQVAQMQENGRYALQLLSREVAHSGFLGGMSAVDDVTTAETFANTCADWFNPLAKPVEVYSAADANSKTCFTDAGVTVKSDTEVLVIKRTDGKQSASADADKLYFRTSGQGGSIIKTTSAGSTPAGFVDWEYFTEIFYIQDDDSDGDGVSVPGLFRMRLIVSGGAITVVNDGMLVPGVRNFGLLYGVDTGEDDGIADEYILASSYAGNMSQVVSARISVLVSSVHEDQYYENNKQYTLFPSMQAAAYVSGLSAVAGGGSKYYARVFSTTTQVRNNAYRIQIYSIATQ